MDTFVHIYSFSRVCMFFNYFLMNTCLHMNQYCDKNAYKALHIYLLLGTQISFCHLRIIMYKINFTTDFVAPTGTAEKDWLFCWDTSQRKGDGVRERVYV